MSPDTGSTQHTTRWEILALLAILLVAGAFRFYALDLIPPGLHFDEAFDGVKAREIVRTGQVPIFYTENFGEEPLFMVLVAGAFKLFGESAWAVRATSALVGVATVLALYLLARVMTSPLPPSPPFPSPHRGGEGGLEGRGEVALLAAFVLAVLYWHVTFSRIGVESNLVPLVETCCFLCFWWGLSAPPFAHDVVRGAGWRDASPWRWGKFALSGVFLGLGFYTYPAFRAVPVLLVAFWAYLGLTQRGWLRRTWPQLVLLVAVALVVFAPLGLYYVANPLSFSTRPGQVGTLTLNDLLANVGRVAGMWTFAGDADPRNNLPGRPALDAFLGLGFFVGLGFCLWRWRRPAYAFPILWLGAMTVPTLLSEYAPHFRRAIGATPAVALLVAIGLAVLTETIWAAAGRLRARLRVLARGGVLAGLGLGLLVSTTLTATDYFLVWGPSPDLFYAYDEGLTHIARYVDSLPDGVRPYLSPVAFDHPTLAFFLDGRQLASFDGRRVQVLLPPGDECVYVVIVHEDQVTLPWLQQAYPTGEVVWTLNDRAGAPYAVAFQVPVGVSPAITPTHEMHASLGTVVALAGYDLPATAVRPGETLRVTLYWRGRALPEENYTAFVQLLGPTNPATGTPLWAQADQQPGGGAYPTSRWAIGETILDSYTLTVPASAPSGEYRLVAGMYLLRTMERLPATDEGGARYPDDAVPLTTVRVGL